MAQTHKHFDKNNKKHISVVSVTSREVSGDRPLRPNKAEGLRQCRTNLARDTPQQAVKRGAHDCESMVQGERGDGAVEWKSIGR